MHSHLVILIEYYQVVSRYNSSAKEINKQFIHSFISILMCQTYDDNIGPKFKKPSFAFLGAFFLFRGIKTVKSELF